MTAPGGRHPFSVAAWILVGAVAVAVTFGVVAGILSRVLLVDLVAMWPLFAVSAILGVVGWLRRNKRGPRAQAILPLSIFTALVLGLAIHLGGWDQLPSAVAHLQGPPATELSDPTQLTAQISGDLRIGPSNGSAGYEVRPILRGGDVAVPEALETSVDGELSIQLGSDESTPSWYSFSGWEMSLAPIVGWRLVLNGVIEADLRDLRVDALAMGGSGVVRLGEAPESGGSVVASGDFTISVPAGSAVDVVGNAVVPSDWSQGDSQSSPQAASGSPLWTIRVEGDVPLRVIER